MTDSDGRDQIRLLVNAGVVRVVDQEADLFAIVEVSGEGG
jgi:hypothetical protein